MIRIISLLMIGVVSYSLGADCGIDGKDCLCGTTNPDKIKYYNRMNYFNPRARSKKSVGARKSKEGDWPWLVNVAVDDTTCTGVILSPDWVLTSNCLGKTDYTNFTGSIQYGNPDLTKTLITNIKEIIPHPEFQILNSTRIYKINDIALVKLAEEIGFNSTLHGICIRENLNHDEKEIAVFAGYGRKFYRVLDYNRTIDPEPLNDNEVYYGDPDVLRETPVSPQPDDTCEIPPEGQKILICTGNSAHGPTTGDEGGPLMLVRRNKFLLYGIVSGYTNRPFEEDLLAILNSATYTQVNHYCEWIKEITGGEFVCESFSG